MSLGRAVAGQTAWAGGSVRPRTAGWWLMRLRPPEATLRSSLRLS